MTTISDEDGRNRLIEAKSMLVAQHPFFASLLYSLVKDVSYKPDLDTAATDGTTIWVGPWFATRPIQERACVLAHEIAHVMFDHMARSKLYMDRGFGPDMMPFEFNKMNKAQDYVINDLLTKAGMKLPKEGLLDAKYTADMLSDVVYTQLPPDPQDDGGGSGKDDGHGGFDKHIPGRQGRGQQDDPTTQDNVKQAIIQAANAAKAMGKLPMAIERMVNDIVEPKKNWKEIYHDMLVNCTGKDELTWARCNRRRLALPPHIPFPGKTGFNMGTLVLAIDTSGSISDKELAAFMGATKENMEQVHPRELHIIWWDTNAAAIQLEDMDDIETLRPYGGGGTDYTCVPKKIEELGLEPDVVVCLTDGMVHWPDESEIRWPHITLSTTDQTAPFGKNIRLEIG